MDQRQQEQINEAAERFADAISDSYRTVSERAVSAQELNSELTQNFFNGVINNLRQQADRNRQTTEQLAESQQRQREASQALTQESVNSYMEFVNSVFSYYQGNVEQIQQQAEQAQQQASDASATPATSSSEGGATGTQASEETPAATPESDQAGASESETDVESLLEDYDSMNVREVSEKLDGLSADEIRQLRDYEAQNKNRSTLIERFDLRLEAESS